MDRSRHSRRDRGRRRRPAREGEKESEYVEMREDIESKERSKLYEEEENRPRASIDENDNSQQEEEPEQDDLPQFDDPDLRRGMHRKRAVYIKIREVAGFDLAFDYIRRKLRPETLEGVESVSRWGMHWAVEIGPWTIELGKDPKTLKKPVVIVTHNNNLDASWGNEVDRMKVGMSSLSDRQLSHPERFIGGHPETYDLLTNNCQIVASKISIFLSDNPWEAFDTIYSARSDFSEILDIETILEYMDACSEDRGDFRLITREVAYILGDSLAPLLQDSLAPFLDPSLQKSASKFSDIRESYDKWESRVLSLLR